MTPSLSQLLFSVFIGAPLGDGGEYVQGAEKMWQRQLDFIMIKALDQAFLSLAPCIVKAHTIYEIYRRRGQHRLRGKDDVLYHVFF